MNAVILAVFAFLLVQFAIGAFVARRLRTEDDYLVAGRSLGWGLGTFTIYATWFGAETTVGAAGEIYRDGVGATSAEPFGYAMALVLMGLVFAAPLWRRGLSTLADLYRLRYSAGVERLAAIILIPGSLLWAAAQVRAFGQVLSVAGGSFSVEMGIAIAALLTIAYTTLGGMLADAVTDLLQGIVLAVSIAVLLVSVGADAGGVSALVTQAVTAWRDAPPSAPVPFLELAEAWAVPVLGSVVATELVTRVISTRSARIASGSALLAGGLYLLVGLAPVVLGLVGPSLVPGLGDAEQLLPTLAQRYLPGFLFVIFAGGLVSAILSTVDTTLLTAGGLLAHNLVGPLLHVADDRRKLRLARGAVVLSGVVAWGIARSADGVFVLVEAASSVGTAGALVTVSFGLFTGFGGARAAGATLVMGLASYLAANAAGITTPFLLSLAASVLTYVLVAFSERSVSSGAPEPTAPAAPRRS